MLTNSHTYTVGDSYKEPLMTTVYSTPFNNQSIHGDRYFSKDFIKNNEHDYPNRGDQWYERRPALNVDSAVTLNELGEDQTQLHHNFPMSKSVKSTIKDSNEHFITHPYNATGVEDVYSSGVIQSNEPNLEGFTVLGTEINSTIVIIVVLIALVMICYMIFFKKTSKVDTNEVANTEIKGGVKYPMGGLRSFPSKDDIIEARIQGQQDMRQARRQEMLANKRAIIERNRQERIERNRQERIEEEPRYPIPMEEEPINVVNHITSMEELKEARRHAKRQEMLERNRQAIIERDRYPIPMEEEPINNYQTHGGVNEDVSEEDMKNMIVKP